MDDDRQIRRGSGRVWAGLFLLMVGGVLLLDQMGFPLPDWLFSWHALLIAIGLFIGLRHGFRGGAWWIMIVIGGIYLVQDYNPDMNLHRFMWPGVLIIIGLVFILRPRNHWHDEWRHEWKAEWKDKWKDKYQRHHWRRYASQVPPTPGDSDASTGQTQGQPYSSSTTGHTYSSEDYVDSTSIFGGVHKKIVSKNFRGGDVTTFLGGTELDLTQADFTGTVRLDVTQVMGGTKILVPSHWEVRSQVTAVFAGFEDKRQQPAAVNPEKVLILEGTSIFGGIELKNY